MFGRVPTCHTLQRTTMKTIVAAARNDFHTQESVSKAIRTVLDHLSPSLHSLVRRGDHVLLKVNMGCAGFRRPEARYTSHPTFVEAIIRSLQDCGARVTFGDDVSRTAHYKRIWETTG